MRDSAVCAQKTDRIKRSFVTLFKLIHVSALLLLTGADLFYVL